MLDSSLTYGFALGGGGVRGYAHLGVLQALKEAGISPSRISGTSAGAVFGVFIAAGHEPFDVFQIMKKYDLLKLSRPKIPKLGLLSMDNLSKALSTELGVKKFDDLNMPFVVAATNFSKGRIEYFSEGPLLQVIQASSSIPVLYAPVNIKGDYYVDGGLLNNVPVDPLLGACDKTIGVSVSPVRAEDELTNLIQMAMRSFQLTVNTSTERARAMCDYFVEPAALRAYTLLAKGGQQDMFDMGYREAKAFIDEHG